MKDKGTAAILALFLGGIGVHRFYVGQIALGVFYFLFCITGVPLVIGIIDCIVWACSSDDWFNKTYNKAAIQQQQFMQQQMEYSKSISNSLANANKADVGTQLEKLHDLMVKGIITEVEFESQKANFLKPNTVSSQPITSTVVKKVEDEDETPFYETATFWIWTMVVILIVIIIIIKA